MPNKEKRIISEYSNEIPSQVKALIKALDDDTRLSIIVALMKNSNMTFTQLKNLLSVNSSSLSYHLSLLHNGGLINNILDLDNNSSSTYLTTDVAELVLTSLFDIVTKVLPERNSPDKYQTTDTSAEYKKISTHLLIDRSFAPDKSHSKYLTPKPLDPTNEFTEWLNTTKNSPRLESWHARGTKFYESGNYSKAIECFDKALEIEPNNTDAWISKGIILHRQKQYTEAIECFDKALEIEVKEKYSNLRSQALSELQKLKSSKRSASKRKMPKK